MSARGIGYGGFLRGLFDDPRAVSAPTPSSAALSQAIAKHVDISRPGVVVELGPGTGVVTQALLDRGLDRDRLIAVECGESFVRSLRQKFPGVVIHHGDALDLDAFIPAKVEVAAVISGIPLLNFPTKMRRAFVREALARGNNRRFIQLSYGWFPPVPPETGTRIRRETVWRNFPPAQIWTYDRI